MVSSVTSTPAAMPPALMATLQTVGVVVVKLTGKPELAVAVAVKLTTGGEAVPNGRAAGAAKLIVCAFLLMVNERVMAGAALDRLLHRCTVVNIRGESYRLREKRQASERDYGVGVAELTKRESH